MCSVVWNMLCLNQRLVNSSTWGAPGSWCQLKQAAVGGFTAGAFMMGASGSMTWTTPPLPKAVTQRLEHVLSPVTANQRLRAAKEPPLWPMDEPPRVKVVRPDVYHASELLPVYKINAVCRVASVFTQSKFADRPLMITELLWAWDFTQVEVSFWSKLLHSHPVNNTLPFVGCPPGKVLLAWGGLLLGSMGWNLRSTLDSVSKCGSPPQKNEIEARLIGSPRRGWKLHNSFTEEDTRWTRNSLSEGDATLTASLMKATGALMTDEADKSKHLSDEEVILGINNESRGGNTGLQTSEGIHDLFVDPIGGRVKGRTVYDVNSSSLSKQQNSATKRRATAKLPHAEGKLQRGDGKRQALQSLPNVKTHKEDDKITLVSFTRAEDSHMANSAKHKPINDAGNTANKKHVHEPKCITKIAKLALNDAGNTVQKKHVHEPKCITKIAKLALNDAGNAVQKKHVYEPKCITKIAKLALHDARNAAKKEHVHEPKCITKISNKSKVDVPKREVNQKKDNSKATKSDDADVPVHLWDDKVAKLIGATVTPKLRRVFEFVRLRLLMVWKRKLRREFCCWYGKKHNLESGLPMPDAEEQALWMGGFTPTLRFMDRGAML
eukprot:scaffold43205_cov34-Attheya_sp.AAC.1